MSLVRHADGTVHFTLAKELAHSPKRYKSRCEVERVPTRLMRIGTIVHFLTLGPRKGAKLLACEPDFGDLRKTDETSAEQAKENKTARNEWRAEHPASDFEIVSAAEWAVAEPAAAALLADPIAREYLDSARHEVPLEWEDCGLKCSTSGIDLVGVDFLGDVKSTSSVEPRALQWHAERMHYHAQLAWYRRGALYHGWNVSRGLFLPCVEIAPPFDVVVLELSEGTILKGEKTLTTWLEELRACESADVWPGYAQTTVLWDIPDRSFELEEGDENDDEEPAA